MNHLPLLIPLPFLLAAMIIPILGLWRPHLAYFAALAGACFSTAAATLGLTVVIGHEEVLRYHLGGWVPPVGIEYVLDPLSAFMAVLITGLGLIVIIYSHRSILHEVPEKNVSLYAVSMLLLAGLTGIVVTGDLFNLFVFLEIASLSAYALMASGEERAPLAAFRYLIVGNIAGTFYLLGVGFIYFSTGSLNMADVAERIPAVMESNAILAAAVLMTTGLAIKMALFPLHQWLPDVYTYAPSAVTGLIAPIMTKVSAYALIRIFITVFQPSYFRDFTPLASVIGWLAAAGIIVASIMAIAQTDLRRMLAYSSISQVAYIGLGIGLANPLGLIGALLHILNHGFMKACLFLVAGGVRLRTGRIEIPGLNGLGKKMPWTMAAFTVSALSMIGVPPTAGFFSKWYLLLGSIEAGAWIFAASILASSLLTAVYFFRILERIYITEPGDGQNRESREELPPGMLVPILVLAAGVLILGLANVLIVTEVLERIVAPLSISAPALDAGL